MFNELTAGHTLIWFFQLYKLYVVHDNDYKWCHEFVPENSFFLFHKGVINEKPNIVTHVLHVFEL
jgi:hypothetical protein